MLSADRQERAEEKEPLRDFVSLVLASQWGGADERIPASISIACGPLE